MNQKKMLMADGALLLTALVWGSGFVATKNALDHYSPTDIMLIRFGIAALIVGLVFFRKIFPLNGKEIRAGMIIGVVLFFGFAFQTAGLQYTLAGKQAFLTGTNVIMVPYLYWFLKKEKPDGYQLAAAGMMLAGIGFLTLDLNNSFSLNKGDILTLVCAVFFAAHILSIGFFAKTYHPIKLTFVQFLTTFVLSGFWRLFTGEEVFRIPTQYLTDVLFLGIFSTFLAFLLQNLAQKHTSSTHAAVLLSLESFFGSVLSILILGDAFSPKMIIGCIIIFAAILTAETKWRFLPGRALGESLD